MRNCLLIIFAIVAVVALTMVRESRCVKPATVSQARTVIV